MEFSHAGKVASHLGATPVAPPDAIFNLKSMYEADKTPGKVDLGIGAYRTNEGKPYVLKVVQKAEHTLATDVSLNKEYLSIVGHAGFIQEAQKLAFGTDSPLLKEKLVASSQAISGTGALRVLAEFMRAHFQGSGVVLTSNPTWGNHLPVFRRSGFSDLRQYRYWNANVRGLDLAGMLEDLRAAPSKSIVLLHACAHNPTGVDPTPEQWLQIAHVLQEKEHFPFLDMAYQGYASGDLDKDAAAVRMFASMGFELALAQSFSKNMGLYGERVGCAHVVCHSPQAAIAVKSQLEIVIRPMYSNPPIHGARLAHLVLSKPENFAEWVAELKEMSQRIIDMRAMLRGALEKIGTPGTWNHITDQIGMFSYTGLTAAQVKVLIEKHHIYLLSNGRISMAGVNTNNVEFIASAIKDAVTSAAHDAKL